MKKNYDLSIIIPVYNGCHCIGACLDSILNQQNANNFQIIVVNDGSNDNTESVVIKYSTKHQNIILLNQPNLGVSVARNTGIRNALGNYITFIDADDQVGLNYRAYAPYFSETFKNTSIDNLLVSKTYLPTQIKHHIYSNTFFANMLNAAKDTGADVIMGGKITLNYAEKYIKRHIYKNQKVFINSPEDKATVLKQVDCRETANFCLYSKKLLDEQKLRFIDSMQLDEDILFCMLACLHSKYVATVPDVTYLYNRHENSLSNLQFNEFSNQRYTLANVQRFSKLLVELSKYPEHATIYNHWLHVFSKECAKVPDSAYNTYFPPMRCAQCPHDKCDNGCILSADDNYVLKRLQNNVNSLIR